MQTLNIVIESAARGRGYAVEALTVETAFGQMNLRIIGNSHPQAEKRLAAERSAAGLSE